MIRILVGTIAAFTILAGGMAAGQRTAPTGGHTARLERGQTLYRAYCQRCHGVDGGDLGYVGIKSLVGIASRKTDAQIAAGFRAAGFVQEEFNESDTAALVAHLGTFREGRWPRGDLLMDPVWILLRGQDPGVRIVDLRPRAAYEAGHIPGAVWLDERSLRGRDPGADHLPTPAELEPALRALGVGDGTHIVACDDQGGRSAARLWYALTYYGFERISLLDGGWQRWLAEKRPVTMDAPAVPAGTPRLVAKPALSCPAAELQRRRSQPGLVVLDTRSPAEFRGEQQSPGASRAGRIPGAVNVEWRENLDPQTLRFKAADELRMMYVGKGITPDKEIVTYCASGGRAAHALFALTLLGYPKVRVYYGSFADYSARPEAPVESD